MKYIADDEFVFQEQREKTTLENLINECSPAVESMFLYAQPKIYLLLQLVKFSDCKLDQSQNNDFSYENGIKENTIKACNLVSKLEDKITIAHIYHYYSLKLGEIWIENDMLSHNPDDPPSSVESESIDIMTVRYAYLIEFIKKIKSDITNLDVGDSVSLMMTFTTV